MKTKHLLPPKLGLRVGGVRGSQKKLCTQRMPNGTEVACSRSFTKLPPSAKVIETVRDLDDSKIHGWPGLLCKQKKEKYQ